MNPCMQCFLCEHEAPSFVFNSHIKKIEWGMLGYACNHCSNEVETGEFLVLTAQTDWPYG